MSDDLLAQLAALAAGRARADLAGRAARQSEQYRALAPSAGLVVEADDALAYALARLPATYGAVSRVLEELSARAPGYAPQTLLDIGAGPGTASWAAAALWPDLAVTMIDHNPRFRDIAATLAADSRHPALRGAEIRAGDLSAPLRPRSHDLVIASYAVTELADASVSRAIANLWDSAAGVLVIVEPGRSRDFRRLLAIRAELVAAGAQILAPCPHHDACPLGGDDWCHFSIRVARTRDHRLLKGGELGYEDEKFSYLVAARPGIGSPATARVIAPPALSKFDARLSLCTAGGLEGRAVAKRDRQDFKAARKLRWGDTL